MSAEVREHGAEMTLFRRNYGRDLPPRNLCLLLLSLLQKSLSASSLQF
jgi:hypothetical protein